MSTATVAAPTKILTDRINRIEVSATMAITAEALKMKSQGIDLADFGAGEPHFATPQHIKDAAIEAIQKNFTRYTAVAGVPEVRKAIVERHAADFGTNYTAEECVFSAGGKLSIFNAAEVLIDHGDEVIIPTPYWVSYKDIVQFTGGKPVFVETSEADNFRVTAKMIEAAMTERTKAIILNTPSNPSGAIIPKDDLYAIVRMAHERGIYVLAGRVLCVPELQRRPGLGRVADGVQGARAGARLALEDLRDDRVARGFCAGAEADHCGDEQAAVAVDLEHCEHGAACVHCRADLEPGVREGDARRLHQAARSHPRGLQVDSGADLHEAEGAFYVYPNISAFLGKGGVKTASELASRLLTEAHVVTVPGEAFGTDEHIRLSYAVSADVIDKGVERIRKFLGELS